MIRKSLLFVERLTRSRRDREERLLVRAVDGPSEELCAQLVVPARDSAAAAAALARALRRLGREPEAQEAIDEALRRFPGEDLVRLEADALARHRHEPLARGYALLGAGDHEGARAVFIAAIHEVGRRLPTTALAATLCGYGWVEQAAGLPLQALGAFDRAVRSDPGHLDAWYGLGHAQRRLGREDRARPAFARAAALGREAPAPLAMIGWCHYEAARFGVAERAFRAALLRQPRDLEANWGLAWTRWRRGAAPEDCFAGALAIGWHDSTGDVLDLLPAGAVEDELVLVLARRALDAAPALAERAARRLAATGREGAGPILAAALAAQDRRDEIEPLLEGQAEDGVAAVALEAALAADDADAVAGLLERLGDEIPLEPRLAGLERTGRLEEALALARRAAEEGRPGAALRAEELQRRVARRGLSSYDLAEVGDAGELAREVLAARDLRRAARAGDRDRVLALLDAHPEGLAHLRECHEPGSAGPGARARLGRLLRGLPAPAAPRGQGGGDWRQLADILERAEREAALDRRRQRQLDRLRRVLAEDELARAAFRRIVVALTGRSAE